jgi:hypothetical protein
MLSNPQFLAALRNALAAAGAVLATLGIVGLSPATIDKIISLATQLGTTATAVAALVGVATPFVAMIYAAISASPLRRVLGTLKFLRDPATTTSPAVKAAVLQASAEVAKDTTVPATPEVQAALATAAAAVTAAPKTN